MVEQVGKNAVKLASASGSKEEMMARIAEAEGKGLAGLFNAPPEPGPAVQVETRAPIVTAPLPVAVPPTPQPKADETKLPNVQKFKEPDGSLNLDKIEKSNEHLQRGIEDRTEKLLALNRELQKKFTQTGQELSAKSKTLPEPDVLEFTEEGKKKIIDDLEKDFVGTMDKVVRTHVKLATSTLAEDVARMKEQTRESRELKELDDLVKDGNEWIITEGLGKFEKVFSERPYLRQSKTPFNDALRFMEVPRRDSQPTARVGAQTPILGASQTVPPPSALPPSTPERDIEILSVELRNSIASKDFQKAREIEAQMDRVYKGMYRR